MRVQRRRKFLTVGLVVGTRSPILILSVLLAALSSRCIFVFDPNSSQFFLEALIFLALVADFTASPGQVNYVALAVGIHFITTTQNILEIAAVAVVIVGLHTTVIIIVAAATAVAAVAAAATAANPVSRFKVSDQRQLR